MRIGIDFGTTTTSAAAMIDGKTHPVIFGGAEHFRTTVFFPEQVADASQFQLTPEFRMRVDNFVTQAKVEHTRRYQRTLAAHYDIRTHPLLTEEEKKKRIAWMPLPVEKTEEQYRNWALQAVRLEWLKAENQRLNAKISSVSEAVFGEEALEIFLQHGSGRLIQSPKSMLGFNLEGFARTAVRDIAANILLHVRNTATRQFGQEVISAVIGRPVEFRSFDEEGAQQRAIGLLQEAAEIAGFASVEFMEEPAAAALGFHHQLSTPTRTLIVDVGGGTTDLAYAHLGDGDYPEILRTWGTPHGGMDVDAALSMAKAMPQFGRGTVPVTELRYRDAVLVAEIPRQRDFRTQDFTKVAEPYGSRLRTLQKPGMTVQLARNVEACKAALSIAKQSLIDIELIEPGLSVPVEQSDLTDCAERFRLYFNALFDRVEHVPELIFLTGGMSRSPLVHALVDARYPGVRKVQGNPDMGVVQGLAWRAAADTVTVQVAAQAAIPYDQAPSVREPE